jgi:putative membrane protein
MTVMKRLFTFIALALAVGFVQITRADIGPSDAQIFGILSAADTGEMQSAELAAQKAVHPEVKKFAQQMLTEHGAMSKEVSELQTKLGLKSDDSVTAKMLRKKGQSDLKKLKELQGEAFDKEYLGDQVLMHKTVLETIEKILIPSADSSELKAMLDNARSRVAAHLELAHRLKEQYDR